MRTIGVISDTHGLLRDEAVDALAGVELIIHAGDVGGAEILERLEQVAPVFAVRGNTDYGALGASLPVTEAVELGSPDVIAWVLHDIAELDLDPGAAGFAVVVYGHSHRPAAETRDGVLYFNPGAAGHRRFDLPITVGRLRVGDDHSVRAEIIDLEG
jgi:putative phosphoesterase